MSKRSEIKFISRLKISKTIKRMVMRKRRMEQQIEGTKLKYLNKMEESLKQPKRERRGKINKSQHLRENSRISTSRLIRTP